MTLHGDTFESGPNTLFDDIMAIGLTVIFISLIMFLIVYIPYNFHQEIQIFHSYDSYCINSENVKTESEKEEVIINNQTWLIYHTKVHCKYENKNIQIIDVYSLPNGDIINEIE